MRDPRLLEIDFLASVERGETKSLELPLGAKRDFFGVDATTCRRMVAHLVMEGFLNGPDESIDVQSFDATFTISRLQQLRSVNLKYVLIGKPFELSISHSGRIRLIELREALDRDRLRDAFGLLYDQRYLARDLAVRLMDVNSEAPLSLIAFDLDHFKAVNDKHGHAAGDEVLKGCFQRVLDKVGSSGDAYRRGGDEVVILLPNTKLETAARLADEIRVGFAAEFNAKYEGVKPTLSVGVTEVSNRTTPEAASGHVDKLAYEAKDSGRNRTVAKPFTS